MANALYPILENESSPTDPSLKLVDIGIGVNRLHAGVDSELEGMGGEDKFLGTTITSPSLNSKPDTLTDYDYYDTTTSRSTRPSNPTRTLFISPLPVNATTDVSLKYLITSSFSSAEPVKVKVVKSYQQHPLKPDFAFVAFETVALAEECRDTLKKMGWNCVGFAKETVKEKMNKCADPNNTNIYLKNLPMAYTDASLEMLFAPYSIVSRKILTNANKVEMIGMKEVAGRGVALVRLATREEAQICVDKLHGILLPDSIDKLVVRFSDTPAQKLIRERAAARKRGEKFAFNNTVNNGNTGPYFTQPFYAHSYEQQYSNLSPNQDQYQSAYIQNLVQIPGNAQPFYPSLSPQTPAYTSSHQMYAGLPQMLVSTPPAFPQLSLEQSQQLVAWEHWKLDCAKAAAAASGFVVSSTYPTSLPNSDTFNLSATPFYPQHKSHYSGLNMKASAITTVPSLSSSVASTASSDYYNTLNTSIRSSHGYGSSKHIKQGGADVVAEAHTAGEGNYGDVELPLHWDHTTRSAAAAIGRGRSGTIRSEFSDGDVVDISALQGGSSALGGRKNELNLSLPSRRRERWSVSGTTAASGGGPGGLLSLFQR